MAFLFQSDYPSDKINKEENIFIILMLMLMIIYFAKKVMKIIRKLQKLIITIKYDIGNKGYSYSLAKKNSESDGFSSS